MEEPAPEFRWDMSLSSTSFTLTIAIAHNRFSITLIPKGRPFGIHLALSDSNNAECLTAE
jgi:hypothetical protein